jgi:hypothetical protein
MGALGGGEGVRVVPAPHALAEAPVIGAAAFSNAMLRTDRQQHLARRSDNGTPEQEDLRSFSIDRSSPEVGGNLRRQI